MWGLFFAAGILCGIALRYGWKVKVAWDVVAGRKSHDVLPPYTDPNRMGVELVIATVFGILGIGFTILAFIVLALS